MNETLIIDKIACL